MTDDVRTDRSQDGVDEFERLGRQAGAELRSPAPADGVLDVHSTAARRRATTTIASVGAALVVVVAGIALLAGGSDQQPAATSTTEAPATTVAAPVQAVQLVGHTGIVNALDATSPSGLVVTASADDSTVRVWSAVSGDELQRVEVDKAYARAVAMSADGTAFAAWLSDGSTSYWLVKDGSSTSPFAVPWDEPGYVDSPKTFPSPDGSLRVDLGDNGRNATLVDAASGAVLVSFAHETTAYWAAWNEDGSLVAVKFGGILGASWVRDPYVKIWRLDTLEPTQVIPATPYVGTADRMQFTPDGRIAFTEENVVYFEPVDPITSLES